MFKGARHLSTSNTSKCVTYAKDYCVNTRFQICTLKNNFPLLKHCKDMFRFHSCFLETLHAAERLRVRVGKHHNSQLYHHIRWQNRTNPVLIFSTGFHNQECYCWNFSAGTIHPDTRNRYTIPWIIQSEAEQRATIKPKQQLIQILYLLKYSIWIDYCLVL
jgi:hypothetical protein